MQKTIRMPEGELMEQIANVIASVTEETAERVEADIARGVKLTNNPVALMLDRPVPVIGNEPPGENEEDVWVIDPAQQWVPHRFSHGEGGYIDARNAWGAYEFVYELLERDGWGEEDIYLVIPKLFSKNHVYGVLTVLLHRFPDGVDRLLMGVRSAQLGGTHVGDASFPGGLVKPGEPLGDAALRELTEEGGCGKIMIFPGYAFDVHDVAPSMTFARAARTTSATVAESYEWSGKKMVWIPREVVEEALYEQGASSKLIAAFRDQRINVTDELKIAGDTVRPALTILEVFPS